MSDEWLLDDTLFANLAGDPTVRIVPSTIPLPPEEPRIVPDPEPSGVEQALSNTSALFYRIQHSFSQSGHRQSHPHPEHLKTPPHPAEEEESSPVSARAPPLQSTPTYADLIRHAFAFDDHEGSYCVFGSFRQQTSACGSFSGRPLEAITAVGRRLPSTFFLDFNVHATTCGASECSSGPPGANQFVLFSAGTHWFGLKFWALCRGFGPEGGFLADWVPFCFARRLLATLGTFSTDTGGNGTSYAPKAGSHTFRSTEHIRDALKAVHSELVEDFATTFMGIATSTRSRNVANAFGSSGATLTSGIIVPTHNICVVAAVGNNSICFCYRRRTFKGPRTTTRRGGHDDILGVGLAKSLSSYMHTMTSPSENGRIQTAVAKYVDRLREEKSDQSLASGLQRAPRLIATQKMKLRQPRRETVEMPSPTQNPNAPSRLWIDPEHRKQLIDEVLKNSPMFKYKTTRGIGFVAANQLGLVSVPDFIDLPFGISQPSRRSSKEKVSSDKKKPTKTVKMAESFRRSGSGNRVGLESLRQTGSDHRTGITAHAAEYLVPVYKHFLLMVSPAELSAAISPQEIANVLFHLLDHKQMNMQRALEEVTIWLRRELQLGGDKTTALGGCEITLLVVPMSLNFFWPTSR